MATVNLDAAGRIGVVTVNRPEKLNALDHGVLDELGATFGLVRTDETIGAVVLTGAGPKAFIAGADISELAKMTALGAVEVSRRGQAVMDAIENCGKPVVAAVNGYAFGGGLETALACHLRVFSSSAKVGLPEVGLGLIPGYGGTQRLPRVVGRGRALEMILTGDPIDAETALRFGLANRVAEPAALLDAAKALAESILKKGPVAVRLALEAVLHGEASGGAEGMALESRNFGLATSSEDMREGTKAFLEKRPPVFKGM